MTDNVNHPAHYESQRIVIEPIDLCESYSFCIGNAIKYLIRAGKKEGNPLEQDLAKARWYLKRALGSKSESDSFRPDVSKSISRVCCAAHAYCDTNEYLDTLFDPPGALRINFEFPGIKTLSVYECIKLIDKRIGEDK